MAYEQKNWRGLPAHPVDEWDSWMLKLADYEEMRLTYDLLVLQGVDMELVYKMMGYADRYRSMEQYEIDAGENI